MEKYGKGDLLDLNEFKILGEGDINKKIKFRVKDISENARRKIEESGGIIEILDKGNKNKER